MAHSSKQKVTPEIPPIDVGPRWPFRNGSFMNFVFRAMYYGCSKKTLKQDVFNALGGEPNVARSERFWLELIEIMRRGTNRRRHFWKLNEEGNRYKIYDVNYLG